MKKNTAGKDEVKGKTRGRVENKFKACPESQPWRDPSTTGRTRSAFPQQAHPGEAVESMGANRARGQLKRVSLGFWIRGGEGRGSSKSSILKKEGVLRRVFIYTR